MFSNHTNKNSQAIAGQAYSYICYTYIDLKENIRQFNVDDFIKFFTLEKRMLSHYQNPKISSHPFSMIIFQCVICSDDNFDLRNDECTQRIKAHWHTRTGIPEEITRYVIKLNLSEILAQNLYKNKSFSDFADHVIGKREDKISEQNASWILGDWQIVEEKLKNEKEEEVRSSCSIS